MRLKENINYADFINEVKKCKSDVFLYTDNGDALDLKSALAQYVFTVLVNRTRFEKGYVKCNNIEDEKLLGAFLQGTGTAE